jgi:hypothetical protein
VTITGARQVSLKLVAQSKPGADASLLPPKPIDAKLKMRVELNTEFDAAKSTKWLLDKSR